MNSQRKAAHNLAPTTLLSVEEAEKLLLRVKGDELLAKSLVAVGAAFNISPWAVMAAVQKYEQ